MPNTMHRRPVGRRAAKRAPAPRPTFDRALKTYLADVRREAARRVAYGVDPETAQRRAQTAVTVKWRRAWLRAQAVTTRRHARREITITAKGRAELLAAARA